MTATAQRSAAAALIRLQARRPDPAVGPAVGPAPADPPTARLRAWAELLRVPAVFTVPGDALAGAAATGVPPGRRTALAIGASLCLYEAGMALNDWADRDEDAVARPHRPLPSGRIRPGAALAAAGALTAAGLALAGCAGRRALAVAAPLAATVWAYDLGLKHTKAGPAAMAAARSLDLLLGAAATSGTVRPALRPAAALGAHTYAVTLVSRREAEGGSTTAPLAALGTVAALSAALARRTVARPAVPARFGGLVRGAGAPAAAPLRGREVASAPEPRVPAVSPARPGGPGSPALACPTPAGPATAAVRDTATGDPGRQGRRLGHPADVVRVVLAGGYAVAFARPLVHAALHPSPPLTQRAVGGGIRAVIPLQGALMARAGAPWAGALTAALGPVVARLARKVSPT